MTVDEFRQTARMDEPAGAWSAALQAMWYAAKGNWNRAHELAQSQENAEGAWVHAYLHRVEGDLCNAAYWYRRARRPVCDDPLESEWEAITGALLHQ